MATFGLIGKVLVHSFSKKFFTEKFANENIDSKYELFEMPSADGLKQLIADQYPMGLNVTIPYKQDVIPFMDKLDETAAKIGAVNTIKFFYQPDGSYKLMGFNTDVIGFENSFKPLLKPWHTKALVLGTGGASMAVAYVLDKLGIEYKYVSRTRKNGGFSYEDLDEKVMAEYTIVINCSPVGTFPNVDEAPNLPYEFVTDRHYLYDLVYNPEVTKFCALGREHGAIAKNGLEMLHGQAIASWEIWNRKMDF